MSPLVDAVARLLLLPIMMVAAALLAGAYDGPGDGFSAGVVASLGVLLQYLVFGHGRASDQLHLLPLGPTAGVAGLVVMVGVLLSGPLRGEPLLAHAPAAGADLVRVGVLAVRTTTLFDLGIAALVFGVLVSTFEMLADIGDPPA